MHCKYKRADHICLIKDQKDDFAQLAFQIRNSAPMIATIYKNYFFHLRKPT